jgi:ATP-dependent DNA helicase DinG
LLSAATPSRLLGAFPPGVRVTRLPLDEVIARVQARLAPAETIGENALA